jgi:hypothetical protein
MAIVVSDMAMSLARTVKTTDSMTICSRLPVPLLR